jgi:exonuclease VII large subunit
MKEFLIRDEEAFKLRATVSSCLSPSNLKCLEFIGECYNDKGEVVRSVKKLSVGQQLVTSFADGSSISAIESIEKEGK